MHALCCEVSPLRLSVGSDSYAFEVHSLLVYYLLPTCQKVLLPVIFSHRPPLSSSAGASASFSQERARRVRTRALLEIS
jgi:hypothetical protein